MRTARWPRTGLPGSRSASAAWQAPTPGARLQPHLPETLIRRMVSILVIAIGARYLWLGLA
jgi:hypothetical protein